MATFVECAEGDTPCFINLDTVMLINIHGHGKFVTLKFANGETRNFDDEKSIRSITLTLDALRPIRE